jgi:predicted DCC family thiol-disulfide oxidoreductase YuxK
MTLTVLYDDDCGICQRSARLIRLLDHGHRLDLVPLQSRQSVDTPALDVLLGSLHAVDEGDHWSVGAEAVVEIARRIPILRPIYLLKRVPGAMVLVRAAYGLVARNRLRLSRALGMDACQSGNEGEGSHVRRPVGSAGSSA